MNSGVNSAPLLVDPRPSKVNTVSHSPWQVDAPGVQLSVIARRKQMHLVYRPESLWWPVDLCTVQVYVTAIQL